MRLKYLLEAEVRSVLSLMGQAPDEMEMCHYSNKNIESLLGSPKRVSSMFNCFDNPNLTSLEHCPKPATPKGYSFNCNSCGLTSLKHAPEVVFSLRCNRNPLTSLEGIPSIINDDLVCASTHLTSLKGIHHHIKHLEGRAMFHLESMVVSHKITSHVLGLMKIKGLKGVILHDKIVQGIINNHLEGNINGSNLEACADELCEEGYEAYAQL